MVMDSGDEDVKLITSLLEKSGFSVFQSANQTEVLNVCRTPEHSVQLMIADTAAPGVHLNELLDEVEAIDPALRVLLISDPKESEPVRRRSPAGTVRSLLKRPFRRAQFIGSVLELTKRPLVRTA